MINPIHPIFSWSLWPFACLFRYLVIMIHDPPVQEVHLVWVVGRSMETVGYFSQILFRGNHCSFSVGLGMKKLLYRRKALVQESSIPESISYKKIMS